MENVQSNGSEPSPERQAELEAAYEAQKDSDAPYRGINIRTLGELNWIIQQRDWSVEEDRTHTNLSGANLSRANFTGAVLSHANLRGANLNHSDLSGALLNSANLNEATLIDANLNGVIFYLANLSGADLSDANLAGVMLYRTLFDGFTTLNTTLLNADTKVFNARWNGAPLDNILWRDVPRLGDEPKPQELIIFKTHREVAVQYRNAAFAYHGLVVALRTQGMNVAASKYRLRELVMQRNALWHERNFGGWFFNLVLGAVAGHGEKPGRAFVAYLSIVGVFAAIFWAVTQFIPTHGQPPLQWYEAIVLSVSSFHGRGFFTNTIQLGDPLAIAAAFEAVMGLFIELVFIATFSRRFLGD